MQLGQLSAGKSNFPEGLQDVTGVQGGQTVRYECARLRVRSRRKQHCWRASDAKFSPLGCVAVDMDVLTAFGSYCTASRTYCTRARKGVLSTRPAAPRTRCRFSAVGARGCWLHASLRGIALVQPLRKIEIARTVCTRCRSASLLSRDAGREPGAGLICAAAARSALVMQLLAALGPAF